MKYLGKIQHEKDLITKEYGDKFTKAILNEKDEATKLPQKLYRSEEKKVVIPTTKYNKVPEIPLYGDNRRYFKLKSESERSAEQTEDVSWFSSAPYFLLNFDSEIFNLLFLFGDTIPTEGHPVFDYFKETTSSDYEICYDVSNRVWLPAPIRQRKITGYEYYFYYAYLFRVSKTTYKTNDKENVIGLSNRVGSEVIITPIYQLSQYGQNEFGTTYLPYSMVDKFGQTFEYVSSITKTTSTKDETSIDEFLDKITDTNNYIYFVVKPYEKSAFLVNTDTFSFVKYLDTTDNKLKTIATTENLEQYLKDNLKKIMDEIYIKIDGGTY